MFPRFAVVLRVAALVCMPYYTDALIVFVSYLPSNRKRGDHGSYSVFHGYCRCACND